MTYAGLAVDVLAHCRAMAACTEEPGVITRTFLSSAMRECCRYLSRWMERLGMLGEMDAAGNLRGVYKGLHDDAGRILIGSHLDTVPDAGAFDGVLGVVLAVALVEALQGERLPFSIEVIGFSEEEGVRFGVPFIGSRALTGTLDAEILRVADRSGITIEEAIRRFGLDPSRIGEARFSSDARAYLEFHIEQGPVLEKLSAPLAVVDAIAGQTRARVTFQGKANHAGTTPMEYRRDALCGAAEWIMDIERQARATDGLVATVGKLEAKPGAGNVVPGEVSMSLDVRHKLDGARRNASEALLETGRGIARKRKLGFAYEVLLDQPAVALHVGLSNLAAHAIEAAGGTPHRMTSGAGHDAMILAPKLPSALIFLRSPGGVSHHPEERVELDDIELALHAGVHFLQNFSTCGFLT